MVDINEYTREASCEYKGELYSVRDNGAVYRHAREGKKVRKLDNVWTFGTKDNSNGYMMINSHRVHIIVAKAFIPGNEDGKMVVDHIDTNRCNNRVENLRWLTRLENVLLNEATLKRVTYLCGGDINKFLENPSCLRDLSGDNQDIMWMRTVTAEEAQLAWAHISAWAKRPNSTFKMMQERKEIKDFEAWLRVHDVKPDSYSSSIHEEGSAASKDYSKFDFALAKNLYPDVNKDHSSSNFSYREHSSTNFEDNNPISSLTEGILQLGLKDKFLFLLCPKDANGGLDSYANNLLPGKIFAKLENGKQYIIKTVGWTSDWNSIQVELELDASYEDRRYDLYHMTFIRITIKDGCYLHSRTQQEGIFQFCDSPYVVQCGAITLCKFPLCPKDGKITLEEYTNVLQIESLCEITKFSKGYVVDREITVTKKGNPYVYVGVYLPDSTKKYADMRIFIDNGKVVHELGSTYSDENALKREFCLIRGQKWDGEVIDDYC